MSNLRPKTRKQRQEPTPATETTSKRPTTGAYVRLGKESLLEDILGETAEHAAVEEQQLWHEVERRHEQKVGQRLSAQQQRLEEIEEAKRREAARRREAEAKRQAILHEIEMEELRMRRLASGEKPPAAAPDTDEFAAIHGLQHAATDDIVRLEYDPPSKPRSHMRVYLAVAILGLAMATFGLAAASNVDLDPTVYQSSPVSVSPISNPAIVVAFTETPHSSRRVRHVDRSRRGASSTAALADSELDPAHRGGSAYPDDEPLVPAPLPVSLDSAEDLWGRGSE